MDQIRTAPLGHSPLERLGINIELRLECRNERPDVRPLECGDDVDVEGRSRFAGDRAGDGAADGMQHAESIEDLCDLQSHADRIEHVGHV